MKTSAIMLAILFAGALAYAQPPKGKGMPPKGTHYAMMQNMLNITDEQKDQMKQLSLDKAKEFLPLRNEMAVLKAQYKALVQAEKPDQKAINANIDKQTSLMNKMMKLRTKYMLKMRDILTEEQWLMIQNHRGMRVHGGMKAGPGPKGMKPGSGPQTGWGYGYGHSHRMGQHFGYGQGPCGRSVVNEDVDIEK